MSSIRHVPKLPKNDMISVTSAWPFRKWGMDIVGPLPEASGKINYLIVVVDYFTKWIEAKAVTSITGKQVNNFAFNNIVCRFGIPADELGDEGLCSRGIKLNSIFIIAENVKKEDRSITREKARRERSKPRRKRSGHQETSSDSEYEEGSDDACEDLNSPYRWPKPTPFTQIITHFKYHNRAKLPQNIRLYEGNKNPEDHLGIFLAAVEQEEWPMPIW
ncbi:reverse transcriptase domain-containing protein [Tanacetum coccineum]